MIRTKLKKVTKQDRRRFMIMRRLERVADNDVVHIGKLVSESLESNSLPKSSVDCFGLHTAPDIPADRIGNDFISLFDARSAHVVFMDARFMLRLDVTRPMLPQVLKQLNRMKSRVQRSIDEINQHFVEARSVERCAQIKAEIDQSFAVRAGKGGATE